MRTLQTILAALALLAAALPSTVPAAEVWLRAAPVPKAMPDGRVVPMWAFGVYDPANPAAAPAPTVPGPELLVPADDTVLVVHLRNELSEPVSFQLLGQVSPPVPTWVDGDAVYVGARPAGNVTARVRSLVRETAPGATETYRFEALAPGTWLYQSGTDPAVQVQMGLYGPARILAAAGAAYPGVPVDAEVRLLFSEVDPAFHEAVAAGQYGPGRAVPSPIGYAPRYFLVNGSAWTPGTPDLSVGAPGAPVLVRLLNAGQESRVPMLLGAEGRLVAENGRPLPYPPSRYAPLLPAGSTLDLLLTLPRAGRYAVLDRRLAGDLGGARGGTLAFLEAR